MVTTMPQESDIPELSFDEILTKSVSSDAYSQLCTGVFGVDLSQLSLFGSRTADLLIGILGLSPSESLVDLGCGVGRITEFISDVTGAKCTGLDSSSVAVEHATKRTKHKNRVRFLVGDMRSLPFKKCSVDAFLAIDSLIFAGDLSDFFTNIRTILRPDGCITALHMEALQPFEPGKCGVPANAISLSPILSDLGFQVHVRDMTEGTHFLCRRHHDLLCELEAVFRAEGNYNLFRGMKAEDERILPLFSGKMIRRILYHAKLP